MQHRPSIRDESYVSLVSARKRKINCYLLVENNLLAHLQGYMRHNQKLILAIERARVAKPGCEMDQGRPIMKKKGSTFIEIQVVPPLHCRDVAKPKPTRSDSTMLL